MSCRICDRINAVKTVKVYNRYGEKTINGYDFKTLVRRRRTGFFFKWYGNIILTPTVYVYGACKCCMNFPDCAACL